MGNPPSPTGNTAALLNDITVKNSAAINTFSDFIGTVADFSGAIGWVISLVNFIDSLAGKGDPTQGELLDIITALNNDFEGGSKYPLMQHRFGPSPGKGSICLHKEVANTRLCNRGSVYAQRCFGIHNRIPD